MGEDRFHCLSGRLGLIMGLLFFQSKNFNGNGRLLLMGEDQFSLLEWETWNNNGSSFLSLIMGLLFFQSKNLNGNGNGRLLLMGEDQFSLLEWETWTNNGSSFLSIKKF